MIVENKTTNPTITMRERFLKNASVAMSLKEASLRLALIMVRTHSINLNIFHTENCLQQSRTMDNFNERQRIGY